MQFNQRNTIVLLTSDYNKTRSLEVKATQIRRFLPCHIINIDQFPFSFKLTSTGRTYNYKGNNTVFLKRGPGGWEKRNYTLQIVVTANNHINIKLLLIYIKKPKARNRTRQLKVKKYYKDVNVIFN
jgi:hypothetical protein